MLHFTKALLPATPCMSTSIRQKSTRHLQKAMLPTYENEHGHQRGHYQASSKAILRSLMRTSMSIERESTRHHAKAMRRAT